MKVRVKVGVRVSRPQHQISARSNMADVGEQTLVGTVLACFMLEFHPRGSDHGSRSGSVGRKKKAPSPGDEENRSAQSPSRKSPRLQPPPPLPLSAFEFQGGSSTRSGSAKGQRRNSV